MVQSESNERDRVGVWGWGYGGAQWEGPLKVTAFEVAKWLHN